MSYTHANVQWERYNRLDDNQIVDKYGDTEVLEIASIIARKQPHSEVITDENGKTFLTKNIYYVDPGVEPNAFNILKYDKLDGELIVNVYEMRTLFNKVRMIKFTTV